MAIWGTVNSGSVRNLDEKAWNFCRAERWEDARVLKDQAFASSEHAWFKFARRATCVLFPLFFPSGKCIPHWTLVKVLHGIAAKRDRGPKDTGRTSGSGGCKKKQKTEAGLPEYYWTERGCPIANSSHLFVRLPFGCAGGCTASILTRKLPNWYTRISYADTNNLKFLSWAEF